MLYYRAVIPALPGLISIKLFDNGRSTRQPPTPLLSPSPPAKCSTLVGLICGEYYGVPNIDISPQELPTSFVNPRPKWAITVNEKANSANRLTVYRHVYPTRFRVFDHPGDAKFPASLITTSRRFVILVQSIRVETPEVLIITVSNIV